VVVFGLAGLAWSAPKKSKPEEQLKVSENLVDVKLTVLSGSEVKVSVKNLGKKQISLFQRGTLLGMQTQNQPFTFAYIIPDPNPVHKLDITSPDGKSLTANHSLLRALTHSSWFCLFHRCTS
jgi:hypothetical protein